MIGLGVMAIMKGIKCFFPRDMRIRFPYREVKKFLFWGAFLRLFMEGYIEILISAYLNTLSNVLFTKSDKFSLLLSYFILGI